MGRKREPRTGPVAFFSRWFRRLRRLTVLAGVAAGAYTWWQRRSGGAGEARGTSPGPGGGGGGGYGSGAPLGGPRTQPSRRDGAGTTGDSEAQAATDGTTATMAEAATGTAEVADAVSGSAWVVPLDGGSCPASHPVKVNGNSGIFHVPGGRFYDRTEASRCYVGPEAAVADGFRPAKA